MATVLEYAQSQSVDISKAANINEYCDIIAGVYFGTAPIRILRRVNNFMIEKFSEVQEPAPETVEFINLQGEALRMVNDALTSNNFSALPLAMEKMKQGVSGILNICKEREEAEKANEAKEAGNTILCIKCGTANPAGALKCAACGTPLNVSTQKEEIPVQQTNSSNILLYLLFGAIALGGIGFAGFKFLKKSKQKPVIAEVAETEEEEDFEFYDGEEVNEDNE